MSQMSVPVEFILLSRIFCNRFEVLLIHTFVLHTANSAPFRTYVAGATYQVSDIGCARLKSLHLIVFFQSERTTQMSLLSAMQSLGFIMGPGIQAALTPIQCADVDYENPYFAIDMYTISG